MKYLTGRPLGVWSALLLSSALIFFVSCQKNPPTSNGNAKGYITSLDSGCSPSRTHGIWYNGVAAGTDSNYLEVTLNVTTPGKYNITTGSENGEFVLPKGPGWGIDVNEKAVRARPPK